MNKLFFSITIFSAVSLFYTTWRVYSAWAKTQSHGHFRRNLVGFLIGLMSCFFALVFIAANDSDGRRFWFLAIIVTALLIARKVDWKNDADNKSATAQANVAHNDDEMDWSFWEIERPLPAYGTFEIDYVDESGGKTKRIVDIKQLGSTKDHNYLTGFCRLRDQARTFRIDRIRHCTDTETGEVITDIVRFFRTKYENSPDYSRDQLNATEYDALRILLFIGKADGQLRAAEKVIIRETCRTLAQDSRLTDSMIDELFCALGVPSMQAFKLAISRLSEKNHETQHLLLMAAERMIATQKSVHANEKEALNYMREKLDSQLQSVPQT